MYSKKLKSKFQLWKSLSHVQDVANGVFNQLLDMWIAMLVAFLLGTVSLFAVPILPLLFVPCWLFKIVYNKIFICWWKSVFGVKRLNKESLKILKKIYHRIERKA